MGDRGEWHEPLRCVRNVGKRFDRVNRDMTGLEDSTSMEEFGTTTQWCWKIDWQGGIKIIILAISKFIRKTVHP
jgi:hypothetical protein